MDSAKDLALKHQLYAGGGLALVGAGLSIAMDAGTRRAKGADPGTWVALGTLGLTIMGAGLSVFGEGVALRAVQLTQERGPAGGLSHPLVRR